MSKFLSVGCRSSRLSFAGFLALASFALPLSTYATPVPAQTPDNGSTLALLGCGLIVMFVVKRKFGPKP